MTIHVTGGKKGGGLLGTLGKALGLASMVVPGLQPFAPYINAASSLMQGDVGGAVGNAVSGFAGNIMDQTKAAAATKAANKDSLMSALAEAQAENSVVPSWWDPSQLNESYDPDWREGWKNYNRRR
jgi:hypothetical protein